MSENLETGESDVIQPAGFAPEPEATAHAAKSGRVARSASSDGKPASVPPSSRPSRHHGTPRARRMNLSVTHISAWSVAKVTFLLAIAGGIIQVVAAALVWGTLDLVGVFDSITKIVSSTGLDAGTINLKDVFSMSTVLSAVTIFSIVEVVLFTLLAAIVTMLYNVVTSLVGGVHVTLGDD